MSIGFLKAFQHSVPVYLDSSSTEARKITKFFKKIILIYMNVSRGPTPAVGKEV